MNKEYLLTCLFFKRYVQNSFHTWIIKRVVWIIREGGMLLSGQWHTLSSIKQARHIHWVFGSSSVSRDMGGYFTHRVQVESVDIDPPEDTPQLFEHHCVIERADSEFAQVNLVIDRVESDFVAPNITRGGIPGDAEAGPGWLWGLKVSRTLVGRHYEREEERHSVGGRYNMMIANLGEGRGRPTYVLFLLLPWLCPLQSDRLATLWFRRWWGRSGF